MGIETSFVNMLNFEETEAAFKPNTAVIIIIFQSGMLLMSWILINTFWLCKDGLARNAYKPDS